ncbi:MAG: hypothetical protein ACR2PT_17380 [Endozoicomonas sp.]
MKKLKTDLATKEEELTRLRESPPEPVAVKDEPMDDEKQAAPPEDQSTERVKELEGEVVKLKEQITEKEKAVSKLQEDARQAEQRTNEQAETHEQALESEQQKTRDESTRADKNKEELAKVQRELDDLRHSQQQATAAGGAPAGDQEETRKLQDEITRLKEEGQTQTKEYEEKVAVVQQQVDELKNEHQQELENKQRANQEMAQAQAQADEKLKQLRDELSKEFAKIVKTRAKSQMERHSVSDADPGKPAIATEEALQDIQPFVDIDLVNELGSRTMLLKTKLTDLRTNLHRMGFEPGDLHAEASLLEDVQELEQAVSRMTQQHLEEHIKAHGFSQVQFDEISARAHIARFLQAGVPTEAIKAAPKLQNQGLFRGIISLDEMNEDSFNRAYYGLVNIEYSGKPLSTLVDEVHEMPAEMRQLYSGHSASVSRHTPTPELSIRLGRAREKLFIYVAERVKRGRVDLVKLKPVLEFYATPSAEAVHPDQGFWDKSGLPKKTLVAYLALANDKAQLDTATRDMQPQEAGNARLRAAGVAYQWLVEAQTAPDGVPEFSDSSLTHGAIRQTVRNVGSVMAYNFFNFLMDDIAYNNGQNIIQTILGTAKNLDEILYLAGVSSQEELIQKVVVWLGSAAAAVWEEQSRNNRGLQFAGSLLPAAALLIQPIIDPLALTSMYAKMGPAAYTKEVWGSVGAFLAINFVVDFTRGAQGTKRMLHALDPAARHITNGLDGMVSYINQYLDETHNPDEEQYFTDSWLALMKNWDGLFDFVGRHASAGRFAGDWAQYSATTIIYGRAIGTPLLQRYGWISDHPSSVKQALLAAGIGGGAMLIDTFMYDMPLNNFQYTKERLAGPAEWLDWAMDYRPAKKGSWSYAVEHELPKYSLNHPESYYRDSKTHQQYRAVMDVLNKGYEQVNLSNALYFTAIVPAFVLGHLVVRPTKTASNFAYNYFKHLIADSATNGLNPINGNASLEANWSDAKVTNTNTSNTSAGVEGIDLSNTVVSNPPADTPATERPGPALTPVDSASILVDSSVITPSAPGTTSIMPSDMTTRSSLAPEHTKTPTPPLAGEEEPTSSEKTAQMDTTEPPAQKEETPVVETAEQRQAREYREKVDQLEHDDDDDY